jgi:hypothetical protein
MTRKIASGSTFWNARGENRVKETAIRWHSHRAERYLKAFSGRRLAQHSVDGVTGYLEQAGRRG